MKKSDSLTFELSKTAIIGLFIYYFVVLLMGFCGAIYVICNLPIEANKTTVIIKTIIVSLSASGMLCSLQYIKRLYKACITNRIVECSSVFGQLGNIIYFAFRPLYSFAFVIVMLFAAFPSTQSNTPSLIGFERNVIAIKSSISETFTLYKFVIPVKAFALAEVMLLERLI